MTQVSITSGRFRFTAVLEVDDAPLTCRWFLDHMPFRSEVIHARWSGEAVWIPLGDLSPGFPFENHTTYPSRGQLLFHPGGLSETELLFPYGSCSFASRVGPLAGNHFLTVTDGLDDLEDFGNGVLRMGAQDIVFELLGSS
jgi:hypothetical protein